MGSDSVSLPLSLSLCSFLCLSLCRSVVNEGSVVSALLQSGLLLEGGISTTLNNNTQQSDRQNK